MEQQTIEQEVAKLITGRNLNSQFHLLFGDVVIEIVTNSGTLVDQLKNYFGEFVINSATPDMRVIAIEDSGHSSPYDLHIKQPDPGKSKIKEEFFNLCDGRIVKKRLTGMFFYFGRGHNIAIGPCTEQSNQIINFINNRYIQWRLNRGCLLGHAAAVILNGRGIAIAGFSGAGKSTLALHVMSKGATFVSNDRLLILKEGDELGMSGVAKLPRINPGTVLHNKDLQQVITEEERKTFEQIPKEELWNLENKYDVFIDRVFGNNRFQLTAKMHMLIILNWEHSASSCSVRQIDIEKREDLLEAFIKSPGLFYEPEVDYYEQHFSPQSYIDHLRHCRIFEFTGGIDFDFAAHHCCLLTEQQYIKAG
jgi:HprK-related kinase B